MAEDGDRGALITLWVVTVVIAAVFLGFTAVALSEEPPVALFGLGGACTGALIATLIGMTRRRNRSPVEHQRLSALVERLQVLESEQQRMAELEERVDFAERMLARAQDEALLPNMRHDGRGA